MEQPPDDDDDDDELMDKLGGEASHYLCILHTQSWLQTASSSDGCS